MSLMLNAMPPPTMPPKRSMPAEMYGWLTASSEMPASYGSTCRRLAARPVDGSVNIRATSDSRSTGGSDAACTRSTVERDGHSRKPVRRIDDVDVVAAFLVRAHGERSRSRLATEIDGLSAVMPLMPLSMFVICASRPDCSSTRYTLLMPFWSDTKNRFRLSGVH